MKKRKSPYAIPVEVDPPVNHHAVATTPADLLKPKTWNGIELTYQKAPQGHFWSNCLWSDRLNKYLRDPFLGVIVHQQKSDKKWLVIVNIENVTVYSEAQSSEAEARKITLKRLKDLRDGCSALLGLEASQ